MTRQNNPKLIRCCAGCGQRWSGAVCRWCGGLTATHVTAETANQVADRYTDALLAKIDGPLPATWVQQDAEAEESNGLLFGGNHP